MLYGEWKFQKDSLYASTTDTFSNGFGKNQIKRYLRRLFKQEMKKFKGNMNYDYHFESDAYHEWSLTNSKVGHETINF